MDISAPENPIRLGWGSCYQSGTADQDIHKLPDPLLIVNMARGESVGQWVDHSNVEAGLEVWIDDSPTAILKDAVYLSLIEAGLAWLRRGGHVLSKCAAGVSRSSYYSVGLHMAALGSGFDDALAMVRTYRPQANPNEGFVMHLRRLEPQLKALAR